MSIEAQKNIDLMCQEGDPRVEENDVAPTALSKRSNYRSQSRTSSIILTRENFSQLPTISKCLPEVTPVASEKSKILTDAKMRVLAYHLPGGIKLSKWSLLFTPRRDGYSYLTFFKKLEDNEQTILVVKDTRGYVFGAFLTEEWHTTSNFYGDGFSFVFTFRDGDDLELYPATGESDNYIQSDEDGIIIGGGDDAGQRASLMLSDAFARGHSGISSCYDNTRLCSQPTTDS